MVTSVGYSDRSEYPEVKRVQTIGIYADGGLVKCNPSPIGGTWAYCFVNEDGERFEECSGVLLPRDGLNGFVTNNVTELHALTSGILAAPSVAVVHIYSDSLISLRRVFDGAGMANVPDWLVQQTRKAKRKVVLFTRLDGWTLLDGHPNKAQLLAGCGKRGGPVSIHNVWADKACTQAWNDYIQLGFDLSEVEVEGCAV